ncbi:polysaccharide biosynthesis/export family protein [Sulfurimonas sp.]|uniref:polysaccharide biosynthesis/export family protein n=1 Tax=Sulfurimonas sp. TaxID=2022749 RepID=UPI0026081CAB|nr:polysaccharide biosynthesis/export family protein [Sulfurimonas sp.]
MIKKLLFAFMLTSSLFGVELSNLNNEEISQDMNNSFVDASTRVFGYNLFNGSFSKNRQYRYNPDYLISIGDTINLKLWGSFDFQTKVNVDSQGNIFIPRVGTVHVAGIRNDQLSQTLQEAVKKVFKKSVFVYADLESYQPVSIFVTGAVNKPGLYEGLSSDSIIQFIDKARGIDAKSGSYRNIKVLRQNKEIYDVDLYTFLLSGSLKLFQFHMGDVIVVESVKNYIEITGDVKRPYRFEMLRDWVTLGDILQVVLPNPTLTNFTVTKYNQDNEQSINIYAIKNNLDMKIYSGESVNFIPDHNSKDIKIEISGEHANIHNLVVKKGTTLQEVFDKIKMTDLSDENSFQLYRKSIAQKQKNLLNAQLDDLAAKTLTAGSLTTEEAMIRKQESQLVMNFIDRARKVEFKGQVIINKDSNLSQIYLEDGDTIYIPKKNRMVIVQGEVMLPGAQTYVKDMTFDDYINACGGFNFRANSDQVLIIQKNGKVVTYDDNTLFGDTYNVKPGDSILVLGKVDTKYLQVIKDITQIVYQIAVGAAIVLRY